MSVRANWREEVLTRYLRALVIAFQMTLRGERPAPTNPALLAWMREAARQVDAVYAAAEASGMPESARRSLRLRLDGRDMSVETVLAGLRHHFNQEYPYLLRHAIAHNLTAIRASVMNDRYWIHRLGELEALKSGPITTALAALTAHLEAIPSPQREEPE